MVGARKKQVCTRGGFTSEQAAMSSSSDGHQEALTQLPGQRERQEAECPSKRAEDTGCGGLLLNWSSSFRHSGVRPWLELREVRVRSVGTVAK